MARKAMREERQLKDLSGIGKSLHQDLVLLGVESVDDLARRDPDALYVRLCQLTKARQDPCVLDVFRCAVAQAKNPALSMEERNWWHWSRLRKSGHVKPVPTVSI